jgi:hypothetical protein
MPDEFRDRHANERWEAEAMRIRDLAKIPLKDRFATESDSPPQSDQEPTQGRNFDSEKSK